MKNINLFYHIYSIEGVESIIEDQVNKLKNKGFNVFINIDNTKNYE